MQNLILLDQLQGWQPHKTEEETKKVLEWMIKSKEIWAIVLKESGKTIGSIGLHKKEHKDGEREIGYVLNPSILARRIYA